jgi:glycosyltransferase involved in cell wall biosynthesis
MKSYEIISFHPGRQHNFEQAYQLQRGFRSFKHLTSLYFDNKTVKRWQSINSKIAAGLKKRSSILEGSSVDTNPISEIKLLARQKFGYLSGTKDYLKRNMDFQNWVIRRYSPPKVCIGYDTSSWLVFQKWRDKSFLILDLSIATPQYKFVLAKESGLNEDFLKKQTHGDEFVYHIYSKELELADLVLCGSEFVKKSCLSIGVKEDKLCILPYGADLKRFSKNLNRIQVSNEIKIVFVGTVNYRKGADVLLTAWEQIYRSFPDVSLHFFGGVQIDVPSNLERVFFHGHVDQEVLIKEMQSAEISVLPTFFEGSSLAVYQSMAIGLAVITTPNSGSLIESGKTGLLVNYGSVDELVSGLKLLIVDEEFRKRISYNAQQEINRYNWDAYGDKLRKIIFNALEKQLLIKT